MIALEVVKVLLNELADVFASESVFGDHLLDDEFHDGEELLHFANVDDATFRAHKSVLIHLLQVTLVELLTENAEEEL